MIVLTGRRVRDRTPSAVHWRLIEYDPATLVPVADLASQWEPAAMAALNGPEGPGRVSDWILAWIAEATGDPTAALGRPADPIAGPGSWYITGHITAQEAPHER